MKIRVRKNPRNTSELSQLIGYQVNSWTVYPDGSMELDLAVNSLSSRQVEKLLKDLAKINASYSLDAQE